MDQQNNFPKHHNNRIFAGIILVAVGAGLLLRNLDFPIPGWLFSWPMILILIGLYSGVKHNFRNNAWIILIGIGLFFLADDFIPGLHMEHLFWPVIIIGLGILFIIRPRRRNWRYTEEYDTNADFRNMDYKTGNIQGEPVTDGYDSFNINSVFSGVKRTVLSKNFKGASISCVFGGAEIDLTRADINGTVIIRFEEVFGGTKLTVPPDWIVQNDIDGIFHGVEDKRKYSSSVSANPNKILILRGTCVFAGIEIRSY